jgi:hypothetical protein
MIRAKLNSSWDSRRGSADAFSSQRSSYHRLHTRQRRHQVTKPGPTDFEIAILIERGAGRRQQHHRIGEPRRLRVACGIDHRNIERLRNLVRHAGTQRARKLQRGFADQIRLSDTREIFGEARDAAELRLAARDPEDIAEGRQRVGGSIGIGAFGVVDE